MSGLLLAVVTLLALAPIVTGISCYSGAALTGTAFSSYSQTSNVDVCYTYTLSTLTYKTTGGSGSGTTTCSTANSYSGNSNYACCSTNLCNGAKMNGMSILMAIAVAMIALFRAM